MFAKTFNREGWIGSVSERCVLKTFNREGWIG